MDKEVNLDDVIRYLSRAFFKAAASAAPVIGTKAFRSYGAPAHDESTELYDYQVEYCYLVDNIKRGPRYLSVKSIQLANELIDKLESEGK